MVRRGASSGFVVCFSVGSHAWYSSFLYRVRLCAICFCSFRYDGIAHGDETAFAASIALQAYFEGRSITKEDMDKCVEYWRKNISERGNPIERRREVCCEPCEVPIPTCAGMYYCCHFVRKVPYAEDDDRNTEELRAVRSCQRSQPDVYACGCANVSLH